MSNAIEGNALPQIETNLVIEQGITNGAERRRHREPSEAIQSRGQRLRPLDRRVASLLAMTGGVRESARAKFLILSPPPRAGIWSSS
jgi:hypothetical protein